MSTKRTELLEKRVRRETNNEEYGDNSGIRTTTIVGYLNDAIGFLEEGFANVYSNFFESDPAYIDIVAYQDTYDLPSSLLHGAGVKEVHALHDDNDYYRIDKKTSGVHSSTNGTSNQVCRYHIIGTKIVVHPLPTVNKTNGLKLYGTKRLNRLDVRRGKVDAVTLNTGNKTITTLSLDLNTLLSQENHEFDEHDYICVVDKDGAFKMKDIPIEGIDVSNGNLTISSGFIYQTGETIAVGDYVVFGKNTSTHQLDLDENAEKYLVNYAKWEVQNEDSNTDSNYTLGKVKSMRDSLVELYAGSDSSDFTPVPTV